MCFDDIDTITDGFLAGDIEEGSEAEAEGPLDIDDIIDSGDDYFHTED